MSLTKEEIRRYRRQMILPEVGEAGQRRLRDSSALIVGLGGLGSPVALYLAAAGVGRLGLIDFDTVETSNLQRQIIYSSSDENAPKTEAAAARLRALNPSLRIDAHQERLEVANALGLFANYDLVIDGADNFATRYLVNDAAHLTGRPLVSASILGFEGQLGIFMAHGGPCYRCLYPEPPPAGEVLSCAEAGVLGALAGVMGSLQALEALKLLLGVGAAREPSLLLYDALNLTFTKLTVQRDSGCALCGSSPTIRELREENFVCATSPSSIPEISPSELQHLLSEGSVTLIDVREDFERAISRIEPSTHLPLGELPTRWKTLSPETPLVLYCRSGQRSLRACRELTMKGFRCLNLRGGLLAWIDEVDPSLERG